MSHSVVNETASMLTLAVRLARKAADISLSRIDSAKPSYKLDESVVTTTDHEIQAMIVRAIRDYFPEHAICAEETAPGPGACIAPPGARFCWVIDPLDGTRNYVAGVPCFATSIAVVDEGIPVVGVIFEHNTNQMFTAMCGGTARSNDRDIHVHERGLGGDHLLGTPSSKDELALRVSRAWHATPGFVCRNLGSTAFEMGLIGSGAMSGMLGCRTKIWDIAAGALIIAQAGGSITDPQGAPLLPFRMNADPQQNIPFLAASAAMHPVLLDSIRESMS